ncbi:hypothetical protein TWF751_001173 [Orbilia oligospora]|nr:hypothetical protein TWF751_001173 [Orbilia oligospora]
MPCTSNQSGPQKHFNRQFVLFALQYTVGDVFFEDMDANAQCFLQRNPQKWFLGPLQAGVFLSDFLDIFDKLATSLPLEAVLTQGQPSDLSKEAILLQVLKYGAKYAPALRAACTVGIGDLDKDIIRRKFVEADAAVKTAIDNACSKLQELRYLDDDKFDDSVQEIQRELTQSIKASQPARGIATKESDRNVGNFVKCVGGGLVITAVGSGILLYGPAVGGFLAIEYAGILQLVVEGLGFGGIVAGTSLASLGAVINGIKAYNSYNYIKGLDDIHVRSFDIYSFLALATLRRTGQLDDDDERFIKFALNYAEIFEGADVIGQWGDPEFIRKYADQTSGHLRQKLEEFKKLSVI